MCRDTQGREAENICDARKAMYTTVYNRYMHKAKNGILNPHFMTDAHIRQEIQKLIQEVQTENEQ